MGIYVPRAQVYTKYFSLEYLRNKQESWNASKSHLYYYGLLGTPTRVINGRYLLWQKFGKQGTYINCCNTNIWSNTSF